jgi:hypothetical protein
MMSELIEDFREPALVFPVKMKVMHRTVTRADRETLSKCLCDVFLGERNRAPDHLAFR